VPHPPIAGPKGTGKDAKPGGKGYGYSRATTTGEKAKEGKGNKAGSAKGSYEHDFLFGIYRVSLLTYLNIHLWEKVLTPPLEDIELSWLPFSTTPAPSELPRLPPPTGRKTVKPPPESADSNASRPGAMPFLWTTDFALFVVTLFLGFHVTASFLNENNRDGPPSPGDIAPAFYRVDLLEMAKFFTVAPPIVRAQLREDLASASLALLCPSDAEEHQWANNSRDPSLCDKLPKVISPLGDPLAGIIWGRFCYDADIVNSTRFGFSEIREIDPPSYLTDLSLIAIPRIPVMHRQEESSLVRFDTDRALLKWAHEDSAANSHQSPGTGLWPWGKILIAIVFTFVLWHATDDLKLSEVSLMPLIINLLPGWLMQKKCFWLYHKHPMCKTAFVLLCLWSAWTILGWISPSTATMATYPSEPVTVLLSVEAHRASFFSRPLTKVGGRYGSGVSRKLARVAKAKQDRKRVSFTQAPQVELNEESRVIPLPGTDKAKIDLNRMRTELVLDKLAFSSRKIFDNQLQHWFIFCRIRNRDPLWRNNTPCLKSENLVLDYVVQSGVIDNKAPATVKVRLAAIKSHHLALGLPDPFYHMPRLSMAVAGLSRRYGRPERRLPATTHMLAWLKLQLIPEKNADLAVLWAALALGFFFLLRASEYLKPSHHTPKNRGLLGRHVTLCKNGQPVPQDAFRSADEVRIEVQGSKTDIYNRGEYRNHFANFDTSHGTRLCVVEAMIILCSHYPSKFVGSEADSFLLTDSRGEQISREEMQSVLKISAEKTGAEMGDYGSHSLRFGGASALWAAFHDTGLVKRWGRWATDTFHTYLWEDRKGSEGIAEAMAKSDVTPA